MWNYVFYKNYLNFKNETELSGQEQYIIELINEGNTSWIPINKLFCLFFNKLNFYNYKGVFR